jgi:hypothetical protein
MDRVRQNRKSPTNRHSPDSAMADNPGTDHYPPYEDYETFCVIVIDVREARGEIQLRKLQSLIALAENPARETRRGIPTAIKCASLRDHGSTCAIERKRWSSLSGESL